MQLVIHCLAFRPAQAHNTSENELGTDQDSTLTTVADCYKPLVKVFRLCLQAIQLAVLGRLASFAPDTCKAALACRLSAYLAANSISFLQGWQQGYEVYAKQQNEYCVVLQAPACHLLQPHRCDASTGCFSSLTVPVQVNVPNMPTCTTICVTLL